MYTVCRTGKNTEKTRQCPIAVKDTKIIFISKSRISAAMYPKTVTKRT